MRSKRGGCDAQAVLWEEPPTDTAPPVRSGRTGASGSSPAAASPQSQTLVLQDDAFARSGWPRGTVLHLTPAKRAARGELVVVRDAGRIRVGWFGADRGRPALLSDIGAAWLSDGARVIASVTVIEAPLAL